MPRGYNFVSNVSFLFRLIELLISNLGVRIYVGLPIGKTWFCVFLVEKKAGVEQFDFFRENV